MEKEYYFFGTPSGANLEIKAILRRLSIPFKQLTPKDGVYFVRESDVKNLVETGYSLVCIDASNISGHKMKLMQCGKVSCLDLIMTKYSINCTPWQNLIRENDEYSFNKKTYSTIGIDMLIRSGYSRRKIDAVRAYDRKAKGTSKAEEKQTDEALKNAKEINGLLIVDNLPHTKYQSVLDKAFWLQRYHNIIIFSDNRNFLYYGYNNIAFEIMKAGYAQVTYEYYNEGHCLNWQKKQNLIKLLTKLSKIKKRQLNF